MLKSFAPPEALAAQKIEINTPLPGPKARRWIELDRQFLSPSYTRPYPLVVARGQGAMIEDVDGNRFLDFTAGIAVCSTGHCHPRVVDAVAQQSERLLHMSGTDFYYEPEIELAQKLAEIAPGKAPKRVFFTNSGTESIEAALKLARRHTGRQYAIAFLGAFHGRTMGALSLTASKSVQKRGFGPLVPGIVHVDYPNPYRSACDDQDLTLDCCLERIETLFARSLPPEEVAAIFVEPIQGEGGYIVPPPEFHRRLKALAERHGILYVVDEVQTGMGRTGTMFAVEQFGVEPDILCLAKGIASGLPLGAIVARADVMDWPSGSHASTFGGNPVACAAALETIALLEEELIANARRVGELLLRRLGELKLAHELIGDVRGRGLMIGVELVRDRQTKERAGDECRAVIQHCFRNGLLLLTCGENTLRLCPPLVIDETQAETAVALIDHALREIAT
ncbi:MAG: acetyl ornithine aminotransferase family protein [Planctomycetes bacterium]|nr:acetyl ornithine aminotransferase family protein [Planctomycetota bacterium]